MSNANDTLAKFLELRKEHTALTERGRATERQLGLDVLKLAGCDDPAERDEQPPVHMVINDSHVVSVCVYGGGSHISVDVEELTKSA